MSRIVAFFIVLAFLPCALLNADEPRLAISSSVLKSKHGPIIKVTVTNNAEKFILLDRRLIWGFKYELLDSAGEKLRLMESKNEQSESDDDSEPRLLALRPGETYTRQVPLRDGIPSGVRVFLVNYGNGIKGIPMPSQHMRSLPTKTSDILKCEITYDPQLVSSLANR